MNELCTLDLTNLCEKLDGKNDQLEGEKRETFSRYGVLEKWSKIEASISK